MRVLTMTIQFTVIPLPGPWQMKTSFKDISREAEVITVFQQLKHFLHSECQEVVCQVWE
jgi:hypothetical protein